MKFLDLNEGPEDPGIFRAVFLAGGPGSGKSYAARHLGLANRGLKTIDSDQAFEYLMQKHDMDMDPASIASDQGQQLRKRAKELTDLRKHGFLSGRLGVVIDGTAKDPNKILNMKRSLENLGYHTALVFVNTSLRTAMQRNSQRARRVPGALVADAHKQVQDALPALKSEFGKDYIEINSDSSDVFDRDITTASKQLDSFMSKPHTADAKSWINSAKLDKVSEAENLKFKHDSDVDIPRKEMPQINIKHVKDGYRVVKGRLALDRIKPSQSERVPGLTQKVIDKMYKGKMQDKPLIVDKHGYLVNGHHRLDALKHMGAEKTNVIMVDATLQDLINDFSHTTSSEFAESYVEPQFDVEWDEAERYPEFRKIGKDAWIELASKGKAVTITDASDINNTDASDPESFKNLDSAKQKRALAQVEKGNVELPIVAVYSDGYKELIGGNTRLTAMMAKHGKAIVWQFAVPDEVAVLDENFKDGKVKGKSRPGRVKKAGASCKGSVSSLRAKAKKYSGERGKMYHWCANMKAAKAKK